MYINNNIITHKFGGSSLASVACYQRLLNNVKSMGANDWIVVSASGKTTNSLKAIYDLAGSLNEQALMMLDDLRQYQLKLINALTAEHQASLIEAYETDLNELKTKITQSGQQKCHPDEFLYYGEIWSARMLTAFLSEQGIPVSFVNAAEILVLKGESVDIDVSHQNLIASQLLQQEGLKVVTGYIASDTEGKICTLGRNGSDYSASLFTKLIKAKQVQFWTDVKGVYSADPNIVESARLLATVDWQVVSCLARSGSTILHSKTLDSLAEGSCEIILRSSMDSMHQGTKVVKNADYCHPLVSFSEGFGLIRNGGKEIQSKHVAFTTSDYFLIFPEFIDLYKELELKEVSLIFISDINVSALKWLEVLGIDCLFSIYPNDRVELLITMSKVAEQQLNLLHEKALSNYWLPEKLIVNGLK